MSKRTIKIVADDGKISVLVDEKATLTLKTDEKTITADSIYKSIDYNYADTYVIEDFDVDEAVAKKNYKTALQLFNLYQQIIEGISKIDIKENETIEELS